MNGGKGMEWNGKEQGILREEKRGEERRGRYKICNAIVTPTTPFHASKITIKILGKSSPQKRTWLGLASFRQAAFQYAYSLYLQDECQSFYPLRGKVLSRREGNFESRDANLLSL
jgi:hypothetical protein